MGFTSVEAQKLYTDAYAHAHVVIDLIDAELKRDEPNHVMLMHYRERIDRDIRDMAAGNVLVRALLAQEEGEE